MKGAMMKAYLLTTGTVFGLLVLAHLWRLVVESTIARDPWFIGTTVLSAGLCAWAFSLIRRVPRSD